ncbi:alpha-glucosides permease MPH2/3 [Sodiomyces alkalinus F11]|uniref:Alpha-glucosides permease MPH2/3 n=1 Tax=Sodiomyces alkalinus (strain CBS 110278 / VKM F-3762 / F11) TaxID=1314773 RepID=A0A3N2QAT4_SODAK|nr:alpha-glucosides permease MPH2/3 [Sodiomyces alkalinus F11]ROT43778.1 alpha-glucosides permease MPH2/3 [Sodiomyces alkalinus F11]
MSDRDDEHAALLSDELLPLASGHGDHGASDSDPYAIVENRVRAAMAAEHAMTPLEAIRAYPSAIFWSLVVSMCVIMEGYDAILIGNFFAYPAFAEKYGQFIDDKGQWQLSAGWQATLGNASTIGCFAGVFLNGFLVDTLGQKRVIVASLALLACFVCMTFFADSIVVLMFGQLFCGVPWGIFASSAPAYASEVLPMCLRVYLTSWTNMCFIIGQLIAAGVLAGLVSRPDEWAYRIPFALQWIWPAFLIPLLLFAPESPWHLVRKGRIDEAESSLRRLQSRSARNVSVGATLASIIHTNEQEKKITAGTRYRDCFHVIESRRTEIACVAFAGQVLSGSAFAYNSTYFFQQVGLSTDQIYLLNIGGTAMSLVGTLVNWFALMPYFGRRRIYMSGLFAMSGILFLVGFLNIWNRHPAIGMIQAFLTLVWTFTFQLSLGQLGWSIPAEVSSTRLRQKTICLARSAYYSVLIFSNALQPYFMNPQQLDLKGYAGFFWGTTAAAVLLWAFFRLPETKGRTYQELDWLFSNKTPTRDFETAEVALFDDGDKVPSLRVH